MKSTAPLRQNLSRIHDRRGNSTDRRRRKLRMLEDPRFKNARGFTCCMHCQVPLTYDTIEADRITAGQSYAYHNVQPSCRHCNASRSDRQSWVPSNPHPSARYNADDLDAAAQYAVDLANLHSES